MPADSSLARTTRAHLERQHQENQDIKNRVLQLNAAQAQEAEVLPSGNPAPPGASAFGARSDPSKSGLDAGLNDMLSSLGETSAPARRVRRVLYTAPRVAGPPRPGGLLGRGENLGGGPMSKR